MVTIAADCSTITLTLNPALGDTVLSKSLEIYKCDTLITTITTPDVTYIVTPTVLGQDVGDEAICDGVYCFVFKVSYETLYEEETGLQAFVSCNLLCDVVDTVALNPTTTAVHLYEAIKYASDCADCVCVKSCQLYDALLLEINKTKEDGSTNTSGCTSCN